MAILLLQHSKRKQPTGTTSLSTMALGMTIMVVAIALPTTAHRPRPFHGSCAMWDRLVTWAIAPAVVAPPTPRFSRLATPSVTPTLNCSHLTNWCHRAGVVTPMALLNTPTLNGMNGCLLSCMQVAPLNILPMIAVIVPNLPATHSTCLVVTPMASTT